VNLLAAPCVSPWAYERIHRWNAAALDPNRSFREDSPATECAALMRLVAPLREKFLVHIDLHETTDSDESEFRPALAARDGTPFEPGEIPDGFYVVGDAEDPQPEFQQAVIAAVAEVTHIAAADAKGEIIGSPVVSPGVINYPVKALGLCTSITTARYRTITEVYPDSARAIWMPRYSCLPKMLDGSAVTLPNSTAMLPPSTCTAGWTSLHSGAPPLTTS